MEPTRETGDDRVMWKIRPLRRLPGTSTLAVGGPWAVVERGADAVDMIDGGDLDTSYEVVQYTVTAEEWNAMPEFDGW